MVVGLLSCNKNEVKVPNDFDVYVSKDVYNTGDTVTFYFNGNADYITFFSGESGSNYDSAGMKIVKSDSTLLSFQSATTAFSSASQPASVNSVQLLASKNFNGMYDIDNIQKAVWTDISDRVTWASGTTATPSGLIHVEDLAAIDSPLYIAYRYLADSVQAGYVARQWVLNTFSLKNYYADTVGTLAANFSAGGFIPVNVLNNINQWSYNVSNSLISGFTFSAPAVGNAANEDWLISRAFNLNTYPVPNDGDYVKTINDNRRTFYNRIYRKAGVYKATFVATNATSAKSHHVVRQIIITVK